MSDADQTAPGSAGPEVDLPATASFETSPPSLSDGMAERQRLLLSVFLGPLLLYALAIVPPAEHLFYWGTHGFLQFTLRGILVFGILFPLWLWLVLKRVSRWKVRDLNLRPGNWWLDILAGLCLWVCLAVFQGWLHHTLNIFYPLRASHSVVYLNKHLNSSPQMFWLWIGPRVWLGAAFLEEFSRTYLLSHLWKLYPAWSSRFIAILVSGILFGLLHIYQGWGGVILLTCVGFFYAGVYAKFGRLLPLIISHGLIDDLIHTLSYLRAHYPLH